MHLPIGSDTRLVHNLHFDGIQRLLVEHIHGSWLLDEVIVVIVVAVQAGWDKSFSESLLTSASLTRLFFFFLSFFFISGAETLSAVAAASLCGRRESQRKKKQQIKPKLGKFQPGLGDDGGRILTWNRARLKRFRFARLRSPPTARRVRR